jgi:hypothetical protein
LEKKVGGREDVGVSGERAGRNTGGEEGQCDVEMKE